MKTILSCILLLFFTTTTHVISQTHSAEFAIRGSVVDEDGAPIPFVNVFLLKTSVGAMTTPHGTFTLKFNKEGEFELVASAVGYERFTTKVNMKQPAELKITLIAVDIKSDEVVVTGSSYGSEKGKGVVMSSMDVITTPGGAADIFQSLKTLPGLTQVSESAELYVRGGDPIETVTMVDQASLYHPYTFESAFGGLFSSLNTSTVRSMFFSSGGFSTKYGNVLSGVLDIDTKDKAPIFKYGFGVSIANATFNLETPLDNQATSFRINGRHSFTKPLFWFNGGVDRFTLTPTSRDVSAALTHEYSETGRIKLVALFAGDEQGVNVERPELSGIFNGASKNTLLNLQVKDILFSNVVSKTSLSFNRYRSNWKLGVLDLVRTDETLKFRTDEEQPLNSRLKFSYGAEAEKRSTSYRGTIPSEDYNIRPDAPNESLDASFAGIRLGGYAEVEMTKLFGNPNLFAVAGVRADHILPLGITWFDPRGSIGLRLSDQTTIRFASGIFRQLPDSRLFAESDGNPNLGPMKAIHYIASYDYKIDDFNNFRVELFHKQYLNLPLEHPLLNYDNSGTGYARGIDMVAKGNLGIMSGWVSYGFISSKRKWMDYTELAPSPFDITHNLAIVLKANITQSLQFGLTYKYATGRPYTEIIGAEFHPEQQVYEPIKGATNGTRHQNYKRLDLRLTHLTRIFGENVAAFYIEGLNILNIENIFGYNYSPDYSERKDIRSYFGRRLVVVGMQVGF